MAALRRGLPVRLQHGALLRRRLRRSAAHRLRVQPPSRRVARRRATQLGHAQLVAEARAPRHATSGRDRPRVRFDSLPICLRICRTACVAQQIHRRLGRVKMVRIRHERPL